MATVMTPVCLFLLFLSAMAVPRLPMVDEPQTRELERESTADEIERANENFTLPDFDIMPNMRRNALRCPFRSCRWPRSRNGKVYVAAVISSSYTQDERNVIINALNSIMSDTCVTFVQKTWQTDYLNFFPGNGCWSYLGRTGGEQLISLQQRGCVSKGTVQHEALHALGFHHEQARSDRNRFVRILTENIREGTERNFRRERTRNLGTSYDFNSIMHYSKFAFSKNGRPTIIARRNPDQILGRATEMSKIDILRVNRLYRCRS